MSKGESLLYLNAIGLNHDELKYISQKFEDPFKIIDDVKNLNEEIRIEAKIKEKIIQESKLFDFDRYVNYMHSNDISYTTIYDKEYPEILRCIDDSPKLLYIRGCLEDKRPGLAVVGSRKCTDYGKWAAEKLVSDLSNYGVNIISGLALGIDKIAHTTAIKSGLKTIAVLGCGVDMVYPASNKGVYNDIINGNGAIISEFRLETPPLPYHFPLRNRIISGLALGLIIIEAKEKSGTLITANYAATQGKEVFSLPGNINSIYSKGTNALIRDGAKIITDVMDIVVELPELQAISENIKMIDKDLSRLSEDEKKVYEVIVLKPMSIDEISQVVNMPISLLMSVITMLELKGIATEIDNKWNIVF